MAPQTHLCPEMYAMAKMANLAETHQAPVVQTLDSAIHWINLYPVDSVISFPNTYPLDSDLSVG